MKILSGQMTATAAEMRVSFQQQKNEDSTFAYAVVSICSACVACEHFLVIFAQPSVNGWTNRQ